MNPMTVEREAVNVNRLRDELLAKYPELKDDEQALLDTLEGLTNFDAMVAAIITSALEDKVMAAAIAARIEDMNARYARYCHREARKREIAADAMALAGTRKITHAEFTASLKAAPPRTIITDENQIPLDYVTVKQVRMIDKNAIKDALKSGQPVPGAVLSNQPDVIQIRTK